jgi:hypothetical protein
VLAPQRQQVVRDEDERQEVEDEEVRTEDHDSTLIDPDGLTISCTLRGLSCPAGRRGP